MGIRLIFLSLLEDDEASKNVFFYRIKKALLGLPRNSSSIKTVPQTDTGGQVEYTKALERMVMKELGKLTS